MNTLRLLLLHLLYISAAMLQSVVAQPQPTRGIGKYPGAPSDNFSPVLTPCPCTATSQFCDGSRVVAKRCLSANAVVRTSSAYDYNLTSQLINDGIVSTVMPPYITASTRQGLLPRRERECAIDGGDWTRNVILGASNHLQYVWHGMTLHADFVELVCTMAYRPEQATKGYTIRVLTAGTRQRRGITPWRLASSLTGDSLPGMASRYRMHSDPNKQTGDDLLPTRRIRVKLPISRKAQQFSALRLELDMPGAAHWTITGVRLFKGSQMLTSEMLTNSTLGSAWMSDASEQQWVMMDLHAPSHIDNVCLQWVRKPAEGYVEVSHDGSNWHRVASLPTTPQLTDNIALGHVAARYVRLLLTRRATLQSQERAMIDADVFSPAYVLSEMSVYGTGGITATAAPEPAATDNYKSLSGGAWQLKRASEVKAGGAQLSTDAADTSSWHLATVPGTVLTSYVNLGILPDPNLGDNLFAASDAFFCSNFWYRRTFRVPSSFADKRVIMNFDGINWKANVWLNGHKIARIEGAFQRSATDITSYLHHDADNYLAVEIIANAHPGIVKEKTELNTDFNGGVLGADNPTFHATTGWDWISTVRGRDIGIWNDVYLTATHSVVLTDPVVTTQLALPDTAATITPAVMVENMLPKSISGTLSGWIGDVKFSQRLTLAAGERREIRFLPEQHQQLRSRRMRLWWPNGYGEPYLHASGFRFKADDDGPSEELTYNAGLRQMHYRDVTTQLKIYCNGKRIVPMGGNWGFSEQNLNYRGREYDAAVRYHRDMHFNMIRNWVGQTGDEEFYDACDRYGIMVWQDFWLANPSDGPDPSDEAMFMSNATDFTQRMRRHASIALYCGRNEGYPPASLDQQLRSIVSRLNPGLLYISSSADEGVSGHGPYWAEPAKTYFERQTGKLHTERGMPNVMTFDGLQRTLPADRLWPQGDAWGQHDFTQQGAQRGASFNAMLERMFGPIDSAQRFTQLAQWINYDGYRAMFESGSAHRQGLILWMSHACWPSMVWQCYDYYLEPTAAFFGCRKACQPLHIQYNALTRNVEVVNNGSAHVAALTARRDILDMCGRRLATHTAVVHCPADTTLALQALALPETVASGSDGIRFVQLTLADSLHTVSDNFYVLPDSTGSLQQLAELQHVRLDTSVAASPVATKSSAASCHTCTTTIELHNPSATPAMMVRLCLRTDDGEQVLPVHYSDNYFHLMPGKKKTVTVEWDAADQHQPKAYVEVSGYNVATQAIAISHCSK